LKSTKALTVPQEVKLKTEEREKSKHREGRSMSRAGHGDS